jgi:hypothetical protein
MPNTSSDYEGTGAGSTTSQRPDGSRRALNHEFNARLRKRLRDNKRAIQYLTNRGLTLETVEHLGLGLSAPYRGKKTRREHADALMYPLRNHEGKFYNKYGYYNVPDVTLNPLAGGGWISGDALIYYGGSAAGRRLAFVCQRPIDLWRHWQALEATDIGRDILLLCSTHESEFPREWKEARFWEGWETVFLGFDNDPVGEFLSTRLAELVGRDARRALVPAVYGKDWTEFWQGGADTAEFIRLLRDAPTFSFKIRGDHEGEQGYGRFPYRPVNINGAYHNGHLYYTVQILNRATGLAPRDGGGKVVRDVERLETVVVRSDRTVHTAMLADAPRGTRERDRVLRLTDGTLIDREPLPNRYGTWSWPSIKAYLDGRSKARPLGEILRDVEAYLRASVWLPYEEDYALLTLTVPVTFSQAIFDSAPLIFVNGPAGSGKSELGRAMARVCCNAYVCGQSSAATIARFIDESRGFVVLDDMEMIGGRGGQFGELVQALKLSYNQATAVKLWTDVRTMRTQTLDFFGVKMINNTRGTGEILGSRMLRVRTARMPEGVRARFGEQRPAKSSGLGRLRDELHTWTFGNVKRIEETYRALYPKTPDRSDEITAPLKVLAHIAGDPEMSSRLEVALTKQVGQPVSADAPPRLLHEALKNLIAQGYDAVSPTHVTLEMRRLHGEGGAPTSGETPEWLNAVWVGRMLHGQGVLDLEPQAYRRIRLFGMNLRFFRLRESYLEEVQTSFASRGTSIPIASRQPTDFCGDCESCPYAIVGCEIMLRRRGAKVTVGRLKQVSG